MLLNATQTGTHWGPHGRRVLNLLATRGPTSREKVHRLTGLHRNLVGDAVRRLIDDGLVRSGKPEVTGRGRPRVPLDLDPARRSLIGIAVTPQTVSACSVNLCREAIVEPIHLATGGDPLRTAAGAIGSLLGDQTLAIGMSITGVIDTAHGVMLESSSVAHGSTSLAPCTAPPARCRWSSRTICTHWRFTINFITQPVGTRIRCWSGWRTARSAER
jgi:hypothetical protein